MKVRVGVSGLGRIGKSVLRAIHEISYYNDKIEVIAVNGSLSSSQHAHLIEYDSIYGKFNGEISSSENFITVNGNRIFLYRERDPKDIPWEKHNIDIVFECTGSFNKRLEAAKHNVKKVIVSAPVQDADATIVFGVNHDILSKEHKIISAGSCTTNCLAPVAHVLNTNFGIDSGFMTTIHAYTNDQNLLDGNHKDPRRARAAALSIIPTSTGAAKTIELIIPELKGKLHGTAIRVPVANVSMIDFKFTISNGYKISKADIIKAFENANMERVLSVCDKPLVSVDFIRSPYSAIVDLTTLYAANDMYRIAAWYDNERAFSLRMLDIALLCYE
ncbi:type I glyceraldehyde-3-phosphate dehydrogenase [Wolbachia endosymbiont of Pentidionis agamae]|uniref:type I glyceraldehyde-3-phosphate dehydrogenase n=1 Tax=Wolbachia endosymbiont of Pentidionis agamae TaxID=3110435 RepID=UPI002FCEC1E5